jgi:hypothetical protein
VAPSGTDQAQPGSARSGHERLNGGRTGPRPSGPRPAEPARLLGPTLLDCADSELSGVLQVLGDPGGVIFFAHGQITAITTPGAPGPERLLAATGRIPPPEGDHQGQEKRPRRKDSGPGQDPGPAAVVAGAGELEAVLRLALADALFAIAAGSIDGYHLASPPGTPRLALPGGVPAGELLAEAARRLEVLDGLPNPISPDRDLIVYVQGGPSSGVVPGPGQREILALANGRRTARDVAFALGRGVYAVTLEIDRMRGAGLVLIDPGTVRVPPYLGLAGAAGDPYPPPAPGQGSIPRRRRGSTPSAAPPPAPAQAQPDRNGLMRLLRAGVGVRRNPRD